MFRRAFLGWCLGSLAGLSTLRPKQAKAELPAQRPEPAVAIPFEELPADLYIRCPRYKIAFPLPRVALLSVEAREKPDRNGMELQNPDEVNEYVQRSIEGLIHYGRNRMPEETQALFRQTGPRLSRIANQLISTLHEGEPLFLQSSNLSLDSEQGRATWTFTVAKALENLEFQIVV